MVKIVAEKGFNTNNVPNSLAQFFTVSVDPVRSDTNFTIEINNRDYIVTGKNFFYLPGGLLSGGVIKKIVATADDKPADKYYTVSELNFDIASLSIPALQSLFDGADTMIGSNSNDTFDAGKGADIIKANGGVDKVTGGRGQDDLWGGSKADDFFFDALNHMGKTASTRDVIHDFAAGSDEIDLSAIDANGGASGNKFSWRGEKAFSGVAGQLRFDKQNKSGTANDKTIVMGDVDGDKKADFHIELKGLVSLETRDFYL